MKNSFVAILALLCANIGFAQEQLRTIQVYSTNTPAQLKGAVLLSPAEECNPKPTPKEVNAGIEIYEEHMYSLAEAVSLKIPIVNSSLSKDLKIYVKDFKRQAEACTAGNGNKVTYGIIIRTVIEIENYDGSLGVNLAAFAASATLNKTTQHFYFYKEGFSNPDISAVLADVSGKNFNVENYTNFQQVMPKIMGLLNKPETTIVPTRIQTLPPSSVQKLYMIHSTWIAYALQCIKNKTTYSGAITNDNPHPVAQDAITAIGEAYSYFEIPQDNTPITAVQSAQAGAMLDKLTVKW